MHRRAFLARVLLIATAASVASAASTMPRAAGQGAAAPERDWQTGKWAAAPTGRVGPTVKSAAIETDLFRLEVLETLARGRTPLETTVDQPVTFAVVKDMVYIKDASGAERSVRLLKRTEKLKSYGAAGGGHYIKAITDGGLHMTLEDGSHWELDPANQYSTASWESMQGISVRPVEQENGYNYFITNLDVDQGAPGRLAR